MPAKTAVVTQGAAVARKSCRGSTIRSASDARACYPDRLIRRKLELSLMRATACAREVTPVFWKIALR